MPDSTKTAGEALPLSLIERAIARVSPGWAFRRYNFLRALKFARTAARKFEAAEESRHRLIRKSKGSADSIAQRSIEILRYRARDLDENYDIASGILDVLESKIVGSEILAHPMVLMEGGKELAVDLNRHLMEIYREWAVRPETTRQHSLGKSQRLTCRSWMRDGECFVQHLDGNIADLEHATDVPYSIELLEADMVPMSLMAFGIDSRLLRYGIRTDEWGKPVEYLMLVNHPGDGLFGLLGASRSRGTLQRSNLKPVPASQIMHLKHVKRIHQTRGVSAFATVFNRLTDLKDYEEAEQTAARIGAYVALAITKSADVEATGGSDSASPREMDWIQGMIFDQLVEGEDVKVIKNERPSNQILPFRQQSLMAASSGTRAGYSSIAKDYSGTYSAQRQELVESELHYAVLTEELVSMKVRPTYRRFVKMANMKGLLPRELLRGVDMTTLFKAAYRGPSVAYIDPMKEINHELIGVQAGFFSKQSVQLKRGGTPADVDAEIEQERKVEKEKGIVTTSNPANKSAASPAAALPAPDEEDEDDAEAVDENGNKYVAIDGKWVPQEMAAIAESLK
ncbi:hypothetical protein LCGC14_2078890 [marine sediment metagenome]|uniref:Phage portal protein n=1 Tax=marine sediment metagenome TaxID=412755 RepID=A0A0F9F3I2_9ZZZZ